MIRKKIKTLLLFLTIVLSAIFYAPTSENVGAHEPIDVSDKVEINLNKEDAELYATFFLYISGLGLVSWVLVWIFSNNKKK